MRRDGILVRIEKELIRRGYCQILKETQRNLEKSYLHSHIVFESIFAKSIEDTFVDWDFDQDTSLIVFILKPQGVQNTIQ